MRILIVGKFYTKLYTEGFALHISETLEAMGHEVVRFEPGFKTHRFSGRFGQRIDQISSLLHSTTDSIPAVRARRAAALYRAAGRRIDATIVCHDFLWAQEIDEIKRRTGAPVAMWFPDHLANFGRAHFMNAAYDAIFFKDPYIVSILRGRVRPPVHYLPECFNPRRHRLPEGGVIDDGYRCDITTAGNFHSWRVALYNQLAEYDVKLWGDPIPRWMPRGPVHRMHQGRFVMNEEKAQAFLGAKIVLNNLHYGEIWGLNVRAFEAAGVGAFQVVDWRPGLDQLLQDGREVVSFRDTGELHAKLRHWLARPEERAVIAAAGKARAHREHTYAIRLRLLLDTLAGRAAGHPMPSIDRWSRLRDALSRPNIDRYNRAALLHAQTMNASIPPTMDPPHSAAMLLARRVVCLPHALIVSGVAGGLYFLCAEGLLGIDLTFVVLTSLLLGYLGFEMYRVRRVHPVRWLANPAVLCSLFTFMLSFAGTNAVYFLPEDMIAYAVVTPRITLAMNKMMFLVTVGAAAMWVGYWSRTASGIAHSALPSRFAAKYFVADGRPSPLALWLLIFVAVASRLLQIRLGVFGYSGTYERFIELGRYTQYLNMGVGLGKVALVVVALQFYSASDRRSTVWLLGVLAEEVLFGFLSGFKSAVGIPFVIVMLCQYLRSGRVSLYWVIALAASIGISYAVIEPFRQARTDDLGYQGNSVEAIGRTMLDAREGPSAPEDRGSTIVNFLGRSNVTWAASEGIAYADDLPMLPDGSPNFLADILLSPLHAWIPRIVWEDKPLGTLGLWYTEAVMGVEDSFSSTGMSAFTYLYFAGGIAAVAAGFFFVGVLQRALFLFTQPWASPAGTVVYLAMFGAIVTVDSAFNGVLITVFRELPLALVLQALIYKRPRRQAASGLRHAWRPS